MQIITKFYNQTTSCATKLQLVKKLQFVIKSLNPSQCKLQPKYELQANYDLQPNYYKIFKL